MDGRHPGRAGRLREALRPGWSTGSLPLLAFLLALVGPLLLADQLHHWRVGPFTDQRWNVDTDRSWIEVLGYLEVLAAVALLGVVAVRRRGGGVYAAWAAALVVLVLDDMLGWHESGGLWLSRALDLPPVAGLRPRDSGELLVWACLGFVVVAVLWLAHRRSAPAARRDSWRLAALVALLMVFAVGVDMLHFAVPFLTSSWPVDHLTTWVEAAGEVAVMAAVTAFALHVARRPDSAPAWSTWPDEAATSASTTSPSARAAGSATRR